jgi:glycosyltransferase involved in cell wall biosynthesis
MQLDGGRFSVVTPNYNMAQFLAETLDSVLANLQPGDEYFVIDGGSTDGSVDILRNYGSRLTGWQSERDEGYADALEKGFRRCTGDFFCWVNSGDLLLKGALATARQALAETSAGLIFGDDVHIEEQGRVIRHSRGYVRSLKNMMLYGGWTPLQEACFWRRSLHEQVGGINPRLQYAADYDFFLRASCAGKCVYIPRIFGAFRRHEGQKSIRGAVAYEAERRQSRQRMLEELAVPRRLRFAGGIWYFFLVRWRHHIARRWLHRLCVPPGVSANSLQTEAFRQPERSG